MDIDKIASTTLGIAGMGIGLGILAHTANSISRMYNNSKGKQRSTNISKYGKRVMKNISKNTYRYKPKKITRKRYNFKW